MIASSNFLGEDLQSSLGRLPDIVVGCLLLTKIERLRGFERIELTSW